MTTITVIPGDGIGPEVTAQATETLQALTLGLDIDVLEHVNAETYLRTGTALSDDDFQRVRDSASVLLGAVGDSRVSMDYARQILLRLRVELDLYVNYRPARLFHDRLSPLRHPEHRAIDCVVVRENTEGLYSQTGGTLRAGGPHELALDIDINTFHGVQRILDYAFSIATRSVCLVDKSNAVPHGGRLWQRCFAELASRHPHLETTHEYVDAAAMKLVADPTRFDVIVANNSYGDILSDLAAQLAGGLGTSASANINGNSGFGLFEPVHGTAPDIAGQGTANPIGAILSGAMLIERLGHTAEAQAVRNAVQAVIESNEVTPDLGGNLGTKDVGAAVRAHL
ncbi:isocitrate/isopropylmalate dehydrogenase family protein [Streptomyces sp. NPDC005244]|uniref:isocitrate/isopropylmalate dehydrogenase family protein n=1 Tax=Streptomyces sp. NPDC005244 TaxID=3364708 RepID=UPI0036963EBE